MAVEIAAAYVTIMPSLKGAVKSIQNELGGVNTTAVGRSVGQGFAGNIASGLKTIGGMAAGALATVTTAVGGLAVAGGISRALQIENAQAKLKGLGHDASSVTEIMNDALASVKGTAYGLGDAASVAAGLSAAGVQQGAQLTGVLKTVADTASISGRSLTDIGTIFQSVAARGKLQGDDMLQLMSSGVPVLQLLAKQTGKTSAQVSAMVSAGQIDFATFAAAMQAGMGGAALAAGSTFTGALDNVKAALSRLGAAAATPALDLLRQTFNAAIPVIDNVTAALTPLINALAGRLQDSIPGIVAGFNAFGGAVSKLTSGGFGDLSTQMGALSPILATLFLPMLKQIPLVKGLFGEFSASAMGAFGGIVGVLISMLALSPNLRAALAGAFQQLMIALKPVWPSLNSILSETGVLIAMFADMMANVVGLGIKFGVFKAAGQIIAALAHTLAVLLDFIIQNSSWIKPLALGIAGVVVAMKGIPAVLGGITTAASGVEKVATAAFDAFTSGSSVVSTLGQMASKLNIVKAAQAAWSAVTKAAIAVQLAFDAALDANPIGIIILAIAALVAGLVWFFTQTKLGRTIWAGFISWLGAAWKGLVSVATTVFTALGSFFSGLWNGISSVAQSVWGAIAGFFSTVWNGIVAVWTAVWNVIVAIFTPIIQGIATAFNVYFTIIKNVLIVFAAFWVAAWQGWSAVFQAVWSGIVAFFTPIIQGIISVVTTAVNWIVSVWTTAWTAVSTFFVGVWNGIVAFVTPIINAIGSVITTVVSTIQAVWNAVWGAISGYFVAVWNNMVAFYGPIINGIALVIGGVISAIQATWNAVWGGISSFFSGVWNGMVNGVRTAVSAIAGVVGGIYGAVRGALSGAASWLVDVGRNIISGLIGGITGAFKWLKDTITGMAKNVLDWAKGVLGIHSPSRAFRFQVGQMVGAGTVLGIKDSYGDIKDAVTGMVQIPDVSSPSLSPTLAGAGAMTGGVYAPVTVQAPNIDSAAVVQLTATALAQRLRTA
jgi:tape measure domain-containing protein